MDEGDIFGGSFTKTFSECLLLVVRGEDKARDSIVEQYVVRRHEVDRGRTLARVRGKGDMFDEIYFEYGVHGCRAYELLEK